MFFFGRIVNRENELAPFPRPIFHCAKHGFFDAFRDFPSTENKKMPLPDFLRAAYDYKLFNPQNFPYGK